MYADRTGGEGMAKQHLAGMGLAVALGVAFVAPAPAQSLDPKAPTPLAAGENRGTLDCMVGAQYWSFKYHKGPGKISIRFASMGLFGNPTTATMQIALRTAAGKAIATNTITS